jgi:PAS domain S-box-containing protein
MADDVRSALQRVVVGVQQDGRTLEQMIDGLPFAAFVANDAGVFVMVNRAASSLTGYSSSELLKLSVWHITPDVHEREAETLWRAFRQQSEQTGTYRVLRKNGATVVSHYAAKTNVVPGLHVSILGEPLEPLRA